MIVAIFLGVVVFREFNAVVHMVYEGDSQLTAMAPIVSGLEREAENSSGWIMENTRNNLKFMQSALRGLISDGNYYGPQMFRDGMVIRYEDGKVIFPDEMPEGMISIEGEPDPAGTMEATDMASLSNGILKEPGKDPQKVILSFIDISDDLFYVEWTPVSEMEEYIRLHDRVAEALDASEKAMGGILFVLDKSEEEGKETLKIKYSSGSYDIADDAETLASFDALIKGSGEMITIGEKQYSGTVAEMKNPGEYLVLLVPFQLDFFKNGFTSIILCLAMLFVAITLIVYMTSLQNYIKKHQLTPEQERAWKPSRVLRKVLTAGLICAIVIFGAAAFVETLSALQDTTMEAQNNLTNILSSAENVEVSEDAKETAEAGDNKEQKAGEKDAAAESPKEGNAAEQKTETEETVQGTDKVDVSAQNEEEEWYVYYGEQMASLLGNYPELATKEKLQEFCDDLQIDYIMLFDSTGAETLCNLPYYGCSLGVGQGEDGEDFKRLLNGVPSIVHQASEDMTLGLTRQNIGVTMPLKEAETPGALIMALLPEQTQRTTQGNDISSPLNYLINENVLYFGADSATGDILVSSYGGAFEGMNISNFGIGENTLKDGYMGFGSIEGSGCYLVTKGQNSMIYYYIQDTSDIFADVLPQGIIVLAAFVVLFLVLTAILFVGFTKKAFYKWAPLGEPPADPESSGFDSGEYEDDNRFVVSRKKWKCMLPEKKAGSVFRLSLYGLLLLVIIYEVILIVTKNRSGSSVIQFIISGNWMKGFNLFSVCAIVLMIIIMMLAVAFVKWILSFLPNILERNGETICKLLYSFVNYAAILLALYFALDYLGFNPSAIIASLGVVGLALSFGAKDMIADIFAGTSIVFENSFQVGDQVEIGGFRGRVESIGIRTTRLVNASMNVKILNNKDIKDVINYSRYTSWCSVSIRVPASQSLERVREIMNRELPAIGEKNEMILQGPFYVGAAEVHGTVVTLRFSAECEGRFIPKVTAFLNEEIIEMMKREGIEMLRMPDRNA